MPRAFGEAVHEVVALGQKLAMHARLAGVGSGARDRERGLDGSVGNARARGFADALFGLGLGNADRSAVLADYRLGWAELCAAAEAGLVHATRAPAHQGARSGIRGNALAPGRIETDLDRAFFEKAAGRATVARILEHRIGRMEDPDGPLLLLASDASASTTGAVLGVDDGRLVWSLRADDRRLAGLSAPPARLYRRAP